MKIAYVRVSSKDQNTARQHDILKHYNVEKVYEEKISGEDTNRPQLKAMLEFARSGDAIYVESFSRLARSLVDLLVIVNQLTAKGIDLISIKENIDTTTPAGRLQLNLFGAIYQFERECIKERQREGIDLTIHEGRPYGRPKAQITDAYRLAYHKWRTGEIKAVEAMRLARVTRCTFYNLAKKMEQITL